MRNAREGGCLCGAVRFRAVGEPVRVSACCCRWCQQRTGSVIGVSIYFEKSQITFISAPTGRHRVVSDAGRWLESGFCTSCGTTVTWILEFMPDRRGLAVGSFDDPSSLPVPERLVFSRGQPSWMSICSDIDAFEAMP